MAQLAPAINANFLFTSVPVTAGQSPTDTYLDETQREKCKIPQQVAAARVHVMDPEELVIDHALDEVE